MTCQELVEVITDYLEDALPEADRRRFEQHLEECPACVAYIEQMRRTIEALGALDERSIPSGARRRLLRAFRGWRQG